jgi:hypothetical protein
VTRRIDLRALAARVRNVAQRPASLRLELFRELALRAPPVSAMWIASFYERLLELVASILSVVRHEILGDCSTSPTGGRPRARYRDLAPILGWRANMSDLTTRPSLDASTAMTRRLRRRTFEWLRKMTGPRTAFP